MSNCNTLNRSINPKEYDVFIGMDVDKRSIALTHVDHLGQQKSLKIAYESETLLSFVRNRFADKRVAFVYEAGPTGFGLYDDIVACKYDCLVVSPASVPTARGKRVRTNRLDSVKLASQLRGGNLESIRVPSETYRMLRELVHQRTVNIKEVAGDKCRVKALFLRNGLCFRWPTPGGYWSKQVISELKDFECESTLRFTLRSIVEHMEFSRKQALQYQTAIRDLLDSNDELSESVKLAMSMPGIGWVVASYAVARIGDWRLLGNSSETASFFGLVPTEDSTGEGADRGSITKAGDPKMRSLIIQASWSAIRKDRELMEFYQRIYDGHPRDKAARIAIVAVARKLSMRLHCVLKERRCYEMR